MTGVTCHVGGAGGVTGGTSDGTGRRVVRVAGRGVGGNCGDARLATRYFTTRPSTPSFDGSARPLVFRILLLE
jgi:hypothetical protein